MMPACGNCGDGCGWHAWRPLDPRTHRRVLAWVACADCNDDGEKPQPDLCEGCGDTPAFCLCDHDTPMSLGAR